MRIKYKIYVLLISKLLICQISIGQVEFLPFDFDKQDSTLNCSLIERYEDLVKYINLFVNPNTASEDRHHLNISIFRLLSDDPVNNSKVGIEDESLDNKVNKLYNRSEYLHLLNKKSNLNYVFQKDFIESGGPYPTTRQTTVNSYVDTEFGINYRSPFYHFGLDYIENTISSEMLNSSWRSNSRIGFPKYLRIKNLRGRLSKMLSKSKYESFGEEYIKKYDVYKNYCLVSYDKRDSFRVEECKKMKLNIITLERRLRNIEVKFQVIYESELDDFEDSVRELTASREACNCPPLTPPEDNDGDGYSYIVDCNDNNPNVYPGAPIDCDNWGDDDNCDGYKDMCCVDEDGDGFYRSIECDCKEDKNYEYLSSKCDCDDTDATVFPGAPIDCNNGKMDDNCDGRRDSLQIQLGEEIQLSFFWDRIYPPYGLTSFGEDGKFILYTILMAGGAVVSNHFYRKTQDLKMMYKDAETFRDQDKYYDQANENHKYFLAATAFTAGVYICSHLDLSKKYKTYNNIRDEIRNRNSGCAIQYEIEFIPLDITISGIGPSLTFNF